MGLRVQSPPGQWNLRVVIKAEAADGQGVPTSRVLLPPDFICRNHVIFATDSTDILSVNSPPSHPAGGL